MLSDNVIDCLTIHKNNQEICDDFLKLVRGHPNNSTVTLSFLPNGLEMIVKIK